MASARQIDKGRIIVGSLTERTGSEGGGAGISQVFQGTVAFTNTTAKTLFTLPANAIPRNVDVTVTTAFNDSGSDLLDVGLGATGNAFVAALDVSATGRKAPTVAGLDVGIGTTALAVTAKYTGQNANSTTGAATITVSYLVP